MTDIDENTTDKLAEERIRGQKAREALTNPLIEETLDGMSEALFDAFMNCPARDQEGLRGIHSQAIAVRAFRQNLVTVMQTGQMAEMQIRELQKQDDKVA